MNREDKFLISHRPYAVDLESMTVRPAPANHYSGIVTAVWFRRVSGVLSAHIGRLWDYQEVQPADATAFLQAYTDGRHGGMCTGRWDGETYWGSSLFLPDQEKNLELLRPMLANFPTVPPSFDGWWTFRTPTPARLDQTGDAR
jgi:hypothetical protein